MKTACLSNSEIEERLISAGVTPTAQRIAICRYVLCEADHPTAEQVKTWADKNFPKLSMATVYNTLGVLVRAGLLKEIRFPHLDSSVYDNNIERHYHFVDEGTGAILDLEPSQVKVSHALEKSYQVRQIEVILKGKRQG